MALTLAELLAPQSPEQLFARLLGFYQANGFPTQSWQTGGVERTRLMAISTVLSDISTNYIPTIASGGLLDYAEQLSIPDWLQLLASNNFNVDFNPAGFAIGTIKLSTVASGAGPYTINDGDLIAVFAASGNRYICNGNGAQTLSAGGTLPLLFVSEFAGAKYNTDPSSSGAISLVTSLPGVVLTNVATTFTSVSHVGSGTGAVTPTGTPNFPHQIIVQINSTVGGTAATCLWSYSADGSAFTTPSAATSKVAVSTDNGGITITLTNGGSGVSFVANDSYLFNSPGSWLSQQGNDIESNASLAGRCRSRWSTLSPIATNDFYQLLAKSTPTVGAQVTQVITLTDTVINNKINIVVAGPTGALPPATVAAIQDYINPRVQLDDFPVVQSPTTLPITIAATVTLQASQQTAAVASIITALENYVAEIGINGTLRVNAVVDLIMNVQGVIDVLYGSATINTFAANLPLGSPVSFVVPAANPTITLSVISV